MKSTTKNDLPVGDMEKIWTTEHLPFIMGGNVWQPMYTTVPVVERRKIKGIDFFSFKTPKGTIRVCEGQTGGIIADSFDELIASIKGVPTKTLQAQIDEARPMAATAKPKTQEYFFSKYKF